MIKQDRHAIKGIQRDLTASKFSSEFAYDAQNIRLTARENSTLLSITNEKGNKEIPIIDSDGNTVTLNGTVIGYNVLNSYLTLFVTDNTTDSIYRLERNGDSFLCTTLFSGNIGLSTDSPIECIGHYESETIQKVYWVDGTNSPRVINIMRTYGESESNRFDFCSTLQLNETVTIVRNDISNGSFPSGVVQYAFSYYNKYGSESAIFYTSPINYISFSDRGGSAEETVSCSFTITIENADTNFDYIRIYSIVRSSIDATPSVTQIADLPVSETVTYTDTNTTGETVDSTYLLYIGGENIIAGTMAVKDNTLFLGNIRLQSITVPENLRTSVKSLSPYFTTEMLPTDLRIDNAGYYTYKHFLSKDSGTITSFKSRETYRFGVQFQDSTGRWSEVVYINDVENTNTPVLNYTTSLGTVTDTVFVSRVIGRLTLPDTLKESAIEAGYVRVRGVVVYPSLQDRSVIAQGIVCPTVFRLGDRVNNAPYAQSSWFSRPMHYYDAGDVWSTNSDGNYGYLLLWFYSNSDEGYEQGDYQNVFDYALNNSLTMEIRQGPRTITLTPVSRASNYGVFTLPDAIDFDSIPLMGTVWISNLGIRTDGGELYFYYKGYEHCNRNPRFNLLAEAPSAESPVATWRQYNSLVIYNNTEYNINLSDYGSLVESRHNHPIPSNWRPGAEIQTSVEPAMYPVTNILDTDMEDEIRNHENDFFVDWNTVTFHSPEIEFDSDIQNLGGQQLQFRIVGYTMVDATKGYMELNASGTYGEDQIGFYNPSVGAQIKSMNAGKNRATGPYWMDTTYDRANEETTADSTWAWAVYLWHRNGSLNNDTSRDNRSATLTSKKISNLKFCGSTTYFSYNSAWNAYEENDDSHTGITPIQIFNSDEVSLVMIDSPENSGLPDIAYYGNVDSVITMTATGHYQPILDYYGQNGSMYMPGTDYDSYTDVIYNGATMEEDTDGYPICLSSRYSNDDDPISSTEAYTIMGMPLKTLYSVRVRGAYDRHWSNTEFGKDPVEMKYNSTPHAVFAFNYTTEGDQVCIPSNRYSLDGLTAVTANNANFDGQISTIDSGVSTNVSLQYHFLWDVPALNGDREGTDSVYQDSITIQEPTTVTGKKYSYFWIGELYRDTVDNRFGGTSESAVLANTWYPAGEPVRLDSSTSYLDYTMGDTFLGRYDCLKTYASTEATNNVTEIMSFMCESHVNTDGRYDRNRGLMDNTATTPSNFNLFNEVYNQKNSYFTYSTLDYETFENSYFPNTIVWSEEKLNSSTTDLWTKFNMTSSLDLDGDKGEITALRTFNNEIYCFQRQGLSNILFNSRIQIPTSDGEPIEITNGLKVSGKRYISNTLGCSNKWSVKVTPSGIFYIDNLSSGIYLFNGQQITSLSDNLGFESWINGNNSLDDWNPVDFGNFVTFYDINYGDVYFTNKDTSLVYSGLLNQFVSFMDYGSTEAMFNMENRFYAIKDGTVWEQFAGDYNMIYGEFRPYSITFIANPDEPYDKIFNNIEFRADCWEGSTLKSDVTFDTLEVWNEYQKGTQTLTRLIARPSSLKKKFRVWRANIPRFNTDWNGVKANGMDRIRNTWAYVKLAMNTENTDRMEFHDMTVHYFI